MRIIGIVPGAKLFGSEDLYADQYFIRTIFRLWSTLPNPASLCLASALGCR